ncbi:MAG: hypothetical protein JWR72_1985 [Flavisolibacter sp.]|nr:hypothetical protein [Flavisolibacter sp.]
MYSTFGHTAIRVQDNASGLDEVYNYGTFEFAPDFYAKFIRGQLLYALSVQSFNEFMYQYQVESRAVIEQSLALNCLQKVQLFNALRLNAQPQNKDYRYDFLFDNCTTRARDMVDTGSGGKVAFKNILPPEPPTFRNLIDIYLNRANQDWSKLGIDLLLGARMDRKASNTEAMFLPDNLLKAFDSATIDGKPLVNSKQTILPMPSVASESLLVTPIIAFSLLLVIITVLTLTNRSWAQTAVGILDFLLFFILGAVGVLLLFMWFGTNHALCANNYNLLWALPTHLLAAFFVHKKEHWVQQYFKAIFWITILLLVLWGFLPQQMNGGFLPLVAAIAIRSRVLSKKKKNASKRA